MQGKPIAIITSTGQGKSICQEFLARLAVEPSWCQVHHVLVPLHTSDVGGTKIDRIGPVVAQAVDGGARMIVAINDYSCDLVAIIDAILIGKVAVIGTAIGGATKPFDYANGVRGLETALRQACRIAGVDLSVLEQEQQ